LDFFNTILELLGNATGWLVSWSGSPYAPLVLFAVSLFDSGALFFPPEPIFIAMSTAQPNLTLFFAAVATAASVLGATAPYLVGRFGGRPLAQRFVRSERIETAEHFFRDHGAPTTFVAALAPLPYPVFALTAGVAHLGYPVFFVASLAGRGARFFGIGLLIYLFGTSLRGLLEDYLGWATLALSVLLVLAYVLIRHFGSRFERRSKDKQT
jgi:membrane protein YqaA with SNARE-associated domain